MNTTKQTVTGEGTLPKLPESWTITRFPNTLEVNDQNGKLVHGEPIPYDPEPEFNLFKRTITRALDPLLRNPNLPRNGGHSLNGWQLHFGK